MLNREASFKVMRKVHSRLLVLQLYRLSMTYGLRIVINEYYLSLDEAINLSLKSDKSTILYNIHK